MIPFIMFGKGDRDFKINAGSISYLKKESDAQFRNIGRHNEQEIMGGGFCKKADQNQGHVHTTERRLCTSQILTLSVIR